MPIVGLQLGHFLLALICSALMLEMVPSKHMLIKTTPPCAKATGTLKTRSLRRLDQARRPCSTATRTTTEITSGQYAGKIIPL